MELARLEYLQVEINVNFQENSNKTFNHFPNSPFDCNSSNDLTYTAL